MAGNFKKDDLRIIKTYNALLESLPALLERRSFERITVNDLCEEAQISRATFYAHFKDKYDLLNYWFEKVRKDIIKDVYNYEELQLLVNAFIRKNQKILTNILKNMNSEILELVQNFIASIVRACVKRNINNINSPRNTVLFNFCTGGLVQLLLWQVKNHFPPEFDMLNAYLYKLLACITDWDSTLNPEGINWGGEKNG